jgi:anti-sigma factor RsiW
MSTIHDTIIDRLSEYVDDDLSGDERVEIDRHLASCAECRGVVEELRTIANAASRLPGTVPERDLWNGIALRVGSGGAARVPSPVRRRFSFTVPQLAAAGIALMLTSGGLVYFLRPQPPAVTANAGTLSSDGLDAVMPVALVDPQYNDAVADLERTLTEGRDRLDPETIRVLEQNLDAIDKAIDQCRRALEADPANSFLNNHLASARQRKLALLRRATALTTGS